MDKFDDQSDIERIRTRSLRVLNTVIFLDMFAVSLVVPLLPYYAKKVGISNQAYGILGTTFGVCQLIGGPFIGKYADQYGRKLFFYFSIIASMLSYFLVGISNTSVVLITSRVVIGLLKQTTTIANSYVSEVTTNSKRTGELSFTRSVMGFAFIIGPTLGGYLSGFDLYIPAFLASSIFMLEFIITFFLLVPSESIKVTAAEALQASAPSLHKTQQEAKSTDYESGNSMNGVNGKTTEGGESHMKPGLSPSTLELKKEINDLSNDDSLGKSKVYYILFLHLLSSFASVSFIESFSIFSRDILVLTPKMNGYMWTYISLLGTLTQRFVVARSINYFGEYHILLLVGTVLSVCVFLYSYTSSFFVILVLLVPIQMCRGILETTVISMATKATKKFGTVLGFIDSVTSITRSMTPTIVGFLIAGGQHYPMIFSSFSSITFVLFLYTSFANIA